VASDWLDAEQGDLDVPVVPTGFMREVVLDEQCYSHPLAPRSRTVYYHNFVEVPNAPPGSPLVRRTALLRAAGAAVDMANMDAEDTVEGFLRSHPHLTDAGLQHANFAFVDAAVEAPAPPSTTPSSTNPEPRWDGLMSENWVMCSKCHRWRNVPPFAMAAVDKQVRVPQWSLPLSSASTDVPRLALTCGCMGCAYSVPARSGSALTPLPIERTHSARRSATF